MQILRDNDYKTRDGYVVYIIGHTNKYPVGYLRGGDGEPLRWLQDGRYTDDKLYLSGHSLDLIELYDKEKHGELKPSPYYKNS